MTTREMPELIEKMRAAGELPDFDTILDVVIETRREYVPKIMVAREEARKAREKKS